MKWIAALCSVSAVALAHSHKPVMPHWDLEMTGGEYRELLRKIDRVRRDGLEEPIALGEKLYKWIARVNAVRPVGQKITLTNAATQGSSGIPIDSPKKYNPSIISEDYEAYVAQLPESLSKHLLGNEGAFPAALPVTDNEFIFYGRGADRIYQTAARWRIMEPHLDELTERAENDVRGYYYLARASDLPAIWAGWDSLDSDKQDEVRGWLVGLCRNSGSRLSTCESAVKASEASHKLAAFHAKYLSDGKKKWTEFFAIADKREDIVWTGSDATTATIPFLQPELPAHEDFVRNNVEQEWRWSGWGLKLDMVSAGSHAFLQFEAGATPHVDELAGNEITMDANQPITEFGVQWTIRHEFGHVLGLPDCYVEFFDETEDAMISYQLDTSDLMCSRAGKMNKRLYEELKRAYFHD